MERSEYQSQASLYSVEAYLTFRSTQMREFFDPSIDEILRLVDGQLRQSDMEGRTVRVSSKLQMWFALSNLIKHLFLVGGFGESKYLHEQLRASMDLRDIQLHQPDTS
jgi:hypothetical protein